MVELLKTFERDQLPALMYSLEGWKSKLVNYSEPVVERLYRDIEVSGVKCRAYLHRIHPCDDPFFHSHPWASAVHVLGEDNSTYEMGIGDGKFRASSPNVLCTICSQEAFYYSMEDEQGHHYVKIHGKPSLSIMIASGLYPTQSSGLQMPLPELSVQQQIQLLLDIRMKLLKE